MAKKKFNKEERQAIIKKLKNIAKEREKASWEKHRAAYKPSDTYKTVERLFQQRNNICEELRDLCNISIWAVEVIDYKCHLNALRDKEIEHLVERYKVNETDLEVEIILMDQDRPIDDLIERLLRNCLCK